MKYNKVVIVGVAFAFLINILTSCSTLKLLKEKDTVEVSEQISFTHSALTEYKNRINALHLRLKDSEELDYEEIIKEIEGLIGEYKKYRSYLEKARRHKGVLIIPPKTTVTLRLDTYCLSSNKSVPDENEPFMLTKSQPDIPLYSEIMNYNNREESVSQQFKQELIWNLSNRVNWEELPYEQREFLLKVDPYARVKITSKFKKTLFRSGIDYIVRMIPFLRQTQGRLSIIEGKAHKFEDYVSQINSIKSKYKKPSITQPIKADGYEIYTSISPEGYINAVVTFINLTDREQIINSYFKPLRKDVQPLGFDVPDWDEISRKYISEFISLISYLLVSMDFIGPGDASMAQNNPDKIIDMLYAFRDSYKAYWMTKKIFGDNKEGDLSDAFRHAYWNALMVRDVGADFANEISYYHELNPPGRLNKETFMRPDSDREKFRKMDLYNNQIGRDIGWNLKQQGILDDKSYIDAVLKNKDRLMVIYQ